MFKGRPEIKWLYGDIVDSYRGFSASKARGILVQRGKKATIGQVARLREELDGFVARANAAITDPEFSLLTAEEQEDVRDIAAESAAAIEELDMLTDPDESFRKLPRSKKVDMTAMLPVDAVAADRLYARISLGRKKEPVQK